MTAKELLALPDAYTTVLLSVVFDQYGSAFFEWDPTALVLQLEKDFHQSLPQGTADRIHAGVAILATDMFSSSFEVFNMASNVLSFVPAVHDQFMPASLDSCVWACTEARLLQGNELYTEQPFSKDIARYTGLLLDQEGFRRRPDVLKFAELPENAVDETVALSNESMYQAYYDMQERKVSEIEAQSMQQLQRMLRQLCRLQFKHGSTQFADELLQKLSPL